MQPNLFLFWQLYSFESSNCNTIGGLVFVLCYSYIYYAISVKKCSFSVKITCSYKISCILYDSLAGRGFPLKQAVAFIAVVCVMTMLVQKTFLLSSLMSWFGYRYTILLGLLSQAIPLAICGIWTSKW